MPQFDWAHRSAGAQIAREDNFVFAQFTHVPPIEVFAAYRHALDTALSRRRGQVAAIHLAQPSSPGVDRSQMNAEFMKLLRDYDGRLAAAALVILSEGFMNAMLRSMAWLVVNSARPKTPVKILNRVDEACSFVAAATGADEPTLARSLRQFQFDAEHGPPQDGPATL